MTRSKCHRLLGTGWFKPGPNKNEQELSSKGNKKDFVSLGICGGGKKGTEELGYSTKELGYSTKELGYSTMELGYSMG